MSHETKIWVEMDEKTIVVSNQKGRTKSFPRCGMMNVRLFLKEMARSGHLNELVTE